MGEQQYTRSEEIANSFVHLFAALISLYGIMILVANSKNMIQAVSCTVFGMTLFLMFQSSVFYHASTNTETKKIFQKIDHSAIYLLIAGTYTPALLMVLDFPWSVVMLVLIWCLAVVGIVFSGSTLKSKRVSTAIYLIMGWMSVFFIYNVWIASHLTVWLLLAGGLFYSLGSLFYLMKFEYTHFIWHLFVIGGAATHYFAILELLKALN